MTAQSVPASRLWAVIDCPYSRLHGSNRVRLAPDWYIRTQKDQGVSMRPLIKVTLLVLIVVVAGSALLQSQERKFTTPPNQVIAIRAGKLFDAKSGNLLNNQIVLIRG